MAKAYEEQWAFYDQLRHYYLDNKGRIRNNYKRITLKFLDYNDRSVNPDAFLRPPQFEALEMYVFVKEFLGNKPMFEIFDDWRKRQGVFADATLYSRDRHGQGSLFTEVSEEQTSTLFKQMRGASERYPNYIFALTMGLGKTVLMATCIFYEFLLANKFPKDSRFCHNALVFAPDRTVLQSLKEIQTLDKSLVVPPEYVPVIDQNLRMHFLEDTGTTLHTLDDSDFNLVISNDQKIITKRRHSEPSAAERLFAMSSGLLNVVYGEDEEGSLGEGDLIINQRFAKLCRLRQVGVYVDEAHHLFGNALKKSLTDKKSENGLRRTINLLDEALSSKDSSVVACYNYTGTPYVKNQVLPDVLYAYGLSESINRGYLKSARVLAFENVRSETFLRHVITEFWETYGEERREDLLPKLAIFASRIEEVESEVLPACERILADLGVDSSKILVNTGDPKQTKPEDIHIFNNLDNPVAGGNEKQFIILVGKGREGWNCRSLFGVALYREPKSKIFVLQATMRCLRQIGEGKQQATVFLSKANFDTLDKELHKNFDMTVKDLGGKASNHRVYRVRMVPPERKVCLSKIKRTYSLRRREGNERVVFGLDALDLSGYEARVYKKDDIARDTTVKEHALDVSSIGSMKYSKMTLVAEAARLMGPEVNCLTIDRLIEQSAEGTEKILDYVNRYNDLIANVIVPKLFASLFSIEVERHTEQMEVSLLKEPKDSAYYEFSANPDLVVTSAEAEYDGYEEKSFHADTYCFDSKPEKELFNQLIYSDGTEEVYFTGMFTSGQSELAIQYVDPESHRIRSYYPDFFVRTADGRIELIEVKGDNQLDNATVLAKAAAAREIADASRVEYAVIGGNFIMENDVTGMSLQEAQKKSLERAHFGFAVSENALPIEFDSGGCRERE